ncbi:MAG TPA: organic hydroperoxide resistance protein [Bdellovibrionota bacterium]|jgi:Ohr subfamily peroxiredoxin|nr:organic hydroperoxide resistance protein [Bdellovibrionota bacterium]
MKTLYETTVHVSGGREGKAHSLDGKLEVSLMTPKELGGPASGTGTNPEQLFAAGYGACFESAVRFVARGKKISIQQASVEATAKLLGKPEGGFQLAVRLLVKLPELDRETAQALIDQAHTVCPYSNATRGNIDVEIALG